MNGLDLREAIVQHCLDLGENNAAGFYGTSPSIVKRWTAGTHRPPLEAASRYVEGVLMMQDPPEASWHGKKVQILFPCYKTTNPGTLWALMAMMRDFGDKVGFDMEWGDAKIEHSRNELATRFLEETDCEWSFWLDDDMIPPVGRPARWKDLVRAPAEYPNELAGMHVINRLLSHNQKLIGGLYFGRNPKGTPMFHEGLSNTPEHQKARSLSNESIPCTWVATGALLVHRSVYEDILEREPDIAKGQIETTSIYDFDTQTLETIQRPRVHHGFFDKEFGGEDVSFCVRANKAGHKAHVDTACQVAHYGGSCYGNWNTSNKVTGGSLFNP